VNDSPILVFAIQSGAIVRVNYQETLEWRLFSIEGTEGDSGSERPELKATRRLERDVNRVKPEHF
jgi:hypothetical protein